MFHKSPSFASLKHRKYISAWQWLGAQIVL